MINHIDPTQVLFIDIETVSGRRHYDALTDDFKYLWEDRAMKLLQDSDVRYSTDEARTAYTDKAALYAEFGKIVCISVGAVYRNEEGQLRLRLKSFANRDERVLLTEFSTMMDRHYGHPNRQYLCGHNIKGFDVPYLCRRMMINQMPLPAMLQITDKKPWETKHLLDTMTLWKFGAFRGSVSLKLLAGVFGIPSPKDDIDGSEVGRVYWEDDDLDRIATYCQKDVLTTAQVFFRYQLKPTLDPEQVEYSS